MLIDMHLGVTGVLELQDRLVLSWPKGVLINGIQSDQGDILSQASVTIGLEERRPVHGHCDVRL